MGHRSMLDWNDLRQFLAVARTGSTLAASRETGVNQTTTARRIAALEEQLGINLFERRSTGYGLTAAGVALVPTAEEVERSVEEVQVRAEAMRRHNAGIFRITTSPTLGEGVLMPILAEYARQRPDLKYELIIADRRLDLTKGEADIALRVGSRPSDPLLYGSKLMEIGWGTYCGLDYAQRHGVPTIPSDLAQHTLIMHQGSFGERCAFRWMRSYAPNAPQICQTNNLYSLVAAARTGLGVTALPCYLGDTDTALTRCISPIVELASQLWLITRLELKTQPDVRAMMRFIADGVRQRKALLIGDSVRAE